MMKNCDFENDILESIIHSIENQAFLEKYDQNKRGVKYRIRYYIWFILLLLISPYKKSEPKIILCATTPLNEKILKERINEGEIYKFARLNMKLPEIRRNRSVVSNYRRAQRMIILIKSIIFYCKHNDKLKNNLCYVFEYYSIAQFLWDLEPNEVCVAGFYNRYCTFISSISHYLNIRVVGVQDGAAINISIPHKIYYDKMLAFDEFEENIIKGFVINSDCAFECVGFFSTLKWEEYLNHDKKIIAIASQDWFTDKTIELVDAVMSIADSDQYTVILYPHYRESVKQYEELQRRYPDLAISDKHRYKNIDVLITFYSTIVYDFWSVNKELPVLCQRIKGFEPGYYGRDNVKVFDSAAELSDFLFQ